jgi:hypothetical protein
MEHHAFAMTSTVNANSSKPVQKSIIEQWEIPFSSFAEDGTKSPETSKQAIQSFLL